MLEDAKVLINLVDLDELRLKEKHYMQLLRDISDCVEFDFDDYVDEINRIDNELLTRCFTDDEIDKLCDIEMEKAGKLAKITVDTKKLEKILLNNCELNKTENELAWFETVMDPQVVYKMYQTEEVTTGHTLYSKEKPYITIYEEQDE